MTTDSEGDGATAADPVETTMTSPTGGTVSISEGASTGSPSSGFEFLGQQVEITAPPATAANPLTIVFLLDASITPEGDNENTIQIFKDGALVPDCTGASGTASPDPCVSKRELLADGDVQITVLTSTASVWNFGVRAQATATPTVTPTPTATPTTAGVAVGPTTDAPSGLPDTGGSPAAATGLWLWTLGIAVALLTLGGLALTATRRRER